MAHISSIIFLALLGILVLRIALKRLESPTFPADPKFREIKAIKDPQMLPSEEFILAAWGKRSESPFVNKRADKLHPSFRELLDRYESIGPDSSFIVLDRRIASTEYSERSGYLRIGQMPDSSDILLALKVSDHQVYVNDLDAPFADQLMTLALDREDYLQKAWSICIN